MINVQKFGGNPNDNITDGGGAHKIADSFEISVKEAQGLIDMYYTAFPTLKKYFQQQQKLARRDGFILIDTVTGRRSYDDKYIEYRLYMDVLKSQGNTVPPAVYAGFKKHKASLERNAQNYPKLIGILKFGELLENPGKDNQQPSLLNSVVSRKVQRLDSEELNTNNLSTSAEHYVLFI